MSAVVTSTKVRCPSRFNSSLAAPLANAERQLEILLNIRRLCTTYRATYRGKLLATAVKWSTHCYGPWHIAKANTRKRKFSTVTTSAFREREAYSKPSSSRFLRDWKTERSLLRRRREETEMNVVFFLFESRIRGTAEFACSWLSRIDDCRQRRKTNRARSRRGKREEEPHRSRLHGKGAAMG